MSTPDSRTNTHIYLYVAFAVLVALSAGLLWHNDQQRQDVQNLQHSLYNAQVEIRVLQAQTIFGTPFIAPFDALDQHGQPAAMPDLGKGYQLFLFFKSWHHPSRLDMMASFGSMIGDNVPVVGVLQGESADEIAPIVEKFRLSFPVFLAADSPFDLPNTPHIVLIDEVGNVLHLAPIGSDTPSVEGQISEFAQMVRRLESAVQPELAGQPDTAVQSESAGGQPEGDQSELAAQSAPEGDQPDPADRPDQMADQLADEKVGIYWPTAVDTRAETVYYPEVPTGVVDLNFDGVVVVQLVVGTNGNVDTAFVERSSGFTDVDSLMVDVARKTVYTPAVHDGERVKMRKSLPFMFRNRPPSPDVETVTEE
ncbi:MAG: energy transducer TonB [Gemmatimonadetes bacterium]|nr:energy transducer TonB [Gemmatimonadota bacterium]